jgi:hypothetical protein
MGGKWQEVRQVLRAAFEETKPVSGKALFPNFGRLQRSFKRRLTTL